MAAALVVLVNAIGVDAAPARPDAAPTAAAQGASACLSLGGTSCVTVVASAINVRPADDVAALNGSSSASLRAARNEFESFQVVIKAGATALTNLTVAMDPADPINQGTATIPDQNVTIYREDYYDTGAQISDLEGAPAGKWPDALIPARDYLTGNIRNAFTNANKNFSVPANTLAVAWVDVLVPWKIPVGQANAGADFPSGNYGGALLIGAGNPPNASVSVHIGLEVLPFAIPTTPTLTTSIDMDTNKICNGFGAYNCDAEGRWRMAGRFTRAALENRISLTKPGAGAPAGGSVQWFRTYILPLIQGSANASRLAAASLHSQAKPYRYGPLILPQWCMAETNYTRAGANAGAVTFKVDTAANMAAGHQLRIDIGGQTEIRTIESIGAVTADGTFIKVTTPLAQSHTEWRSIADWNSVAPCLAAWKAEATASGFADRVVFYCDEPYRNANTWAGCKGDVAAARADWGQLSGNRRAPFASTTSIYDANNYGGQYDASPVRNAMDIFIPIVNHMHQKTGTPYADREVYLSNRPNGNRDDYDAWLASDDAGANDNEVWLYTACDSFYCSNIAQYDNSQYFKGWPGYAIDEPALEQRAMGWQAWAYDATGEYYFETLNLFGTARTDQFSEGGHGDGTLFYPGTIAWIGGPAGSEIPIESMRLKRIRDGREDYEYLKLLSEQNDGAYADGRVEALFPSMYESDANLTDKTAALAKLTDIRDQVIDRLLADLGGGGDGIPPTANGLDPALIQGATPQLGTMASSKPIPVKLTWGGADTGGSGLAKYQLQQSTDGGSFMNLDPGDGTTAWTTTRNVFVDPDHVYQFQLRAFDGAGNPSGWTQATPFRALVIDESDPRIGWAGTWSAAAAQSGAWGGKVRSATASGAAVAVSFTGKDIAFNTPYGSNGGKYNAYLDNVKVTPTARSIYRSTLLARVASFVPTNANFASAGAGPRHTFRISIVPQKVNGVARKLFFDAFVVLDTDVVAPSDPAELAPAAAALKLVLNSTISAQNLPATAQVDQAWGGSTDTGNSGLWRYELQRRTGTYDANNGVVTAWFAYASVGVVAPPASGNPHLTAALNLQSPYQYRVRAVDRAGNASAWVALRAFLPWNYGDTDDNPGTTITYDSLSWGVVSNTAGPFEKNFHYGKAAGRWVDFHPLNALSVAFVGRTSTAGGRYRTLVDGIDRTPAGSTLQAAATTQRKLVFVYHWPTSGPHTLRIEVVPTTINNVLKQVDVDAFVTLFGL